ncbi:SEL1-like repeat protein [Halopseudomonas salegens]|uniref:Alginate biosynthesis protein AlgK n=1 Tax=Halopseudomonas salegens TaxID=1434072 RepID=A0A1H2HSQ9_9GAMM|nr:sel1 repeat family protein [Halopseudomonas salegens]SDU34923.1 alginate biosynthesis protein AlgK [Halopseudomonas salegens]
MRLFNLVLPLALVGVLLSLPVQARGLEQIRYELFKNPQADVEADLRRLVARGDHAAMHLLGDVLSKAEVSGHGETISLFKAAFDRGQGEVTALGALASLMERYPYWREQYREYFRQALQLYPHDRDRQTLAATLSVFLTYPELFAADDAERLIVLHQRSCLIDCGTELYWAILAERQGDMQTADHHYRTAMFTDARAAERYYNFLGPQQDQVFPRVARELEPHVEEMSADAINQIGRVLDRISDLYRIDEDVAEWKRREQAELLGIELEPSPPGYVAESERLRHEALRWAEHAAARNWLPALISRFYFMTSMPDNFSGAEAMELIDRISLQDPVRARSLRASALMVTNWKTLNPGKAHELIQALIAEGNTEGYMLLADLHTRGGLDEPDQQAALKLYQQMAERGSAAAYYRQAALFTSGRAICHDHTRAYAYAMVAVDFGTVRARGLMRQLESHLSEAEKSRALAIRNSIIREFGI